MDEAFVSIFLILYFLVVVLVSIPIFRIREYNLEDYVEGDVFNHTMSMCGYEVVYRKKAENYTYYAASKCRYPMKKSDLYVIHRRANYSLFDAFIRSRPKWEKIYFVKDAHNNGKITEIYGKERANKLLHYVSENFDSHTESFIVSYRDENLLSYTQERDKKFNLTKRYTVVSGED